MRISDWSSDVCSSDLLFALRVGTIRAGATFEPVSREGALVINNLLLSVILAIVLIGTLYPIVAASMGVQLSVGAPFFDKSSEERRVGKGWASTCRFGWSPYHLQKQIVI